MEKRHVKVLSTEKSVEVNGFVRAWECVRSWTLPKVIEFLFYTVEARIV